MTDTIGSLVIPYGLGFPVVVSVKGAMGVAEGARVLAPILLGAELELA